MSRDRRFPRQVFSTGREPDPRFTLANERTFLAWIRTALALIGGGVALSAVPLGVPVSIRWTAVLILLTLGLLLPVLAWGSWAAAARALRRDAPLPGPIVAFPLAAGVFAVAAAVAIGVLAV